MDENVVTCVSGGRVEVKYKIPLEAEVRIVYILQVVYVGEDKQNDTQKHEHRQTHTTKYKRWRNSKSQPRRPGKRETQHSSTRNTPIDNKRQRREDSGDGQLKGKRAPAKRVQV